MPSERRGQDEILREIATERERLADALVDLREGIERRRRVAVVVGGTIAAGLAVAAAIKAVRR